MLTINLVKGTDGCVQTTTWEDTISVKDLIMSLFQRMRIRSESTQRGSLNPYRLDNVEPMSPQKEAELRGLYYDCTNIRILLNELDRRDKIIKDLDHELWLMVNKPGRKK